MAKKQTLDLSFPTVRNWKGVNVVFLACRDQSDKEITKYKAVDSEKQQFKLEMQFELEASQKVLDHYVSETLCKTEAKESKGEEKKEEAQIDTDGPIG